MSVVVVGGGHAAGQCVANLRQSGYEDSISLISSELTVPYQRPPLSKQFLKSEVGLEKVILRPDTFYSAQNVNLSLGVTVTGVDVKKNVVECDDGSAQSYDSLVLATGSSPIVPSIPGVEANGVHLLRTIDDVEAIKADLDGCSKAIVIGGGYIGLEVAASFIEMGIQVHVVELLDRVLQRVTTPDMSKFYERLHADRGVVIHTNDGVQQINTDGESRVTGVRCKSGLEIPADIVVIGIGIHPNVSLASDAGLVVDNGIVVNERCQASVDNVFAIGDCTNHPNALLDRRLRLECVPNAMGQAKTAALNICGRDTEYNEYPWFWSDQYELKLQMAGFADRFDESVTRGTQADHRFIVFYITDGRLTAAESVNSPREFLGARQLLGKPVSGKELSDSMIDLKELIQR